MSLSQSTDGSFQVGAVVTIGRGCADLKQGALWEIISVSPEGYDLALEIRLLLPHDLYQWGDYEKTQQRLHRSDVTPVPEMVVLARMSR